jgi:hypothetical protein
VNGIRRLAVRLVQGLSLLRAVRLDQELTPGKAVPVKNARSAPRTTPAVNSDGTLMIAFMECFMLACLSTDDYGIGTLFVSRSIRVRDADPIAIKVSDYLNFRCHALDYSESVEDQTMMGYAADESAYTIFPACPGLLVTHECTQHN